jgi:NAD(P)-dependent dehydrogenase (short-subunit alcohol dehydrogenase family)
VEEIRGAGGRAIAVEADVANGRAGSQHGDACRQELGTIDVLVNNAGIEPIIPFLDLDRGAVPARFGRELKGEWLCAQAVVRELVARASRERL